MNPKPGLPRQACLSWLEIDLTAIRNNYRQVRGVIGHGTRLFAVVKADAYGHGAIQVAGSLESEGADMLCVARVEEGLELRDAGITMPILVFTPPLEAQAAAAVGANLAMTVSDAIHADAIAAAARIFGRRAKVHLKVDTGMGRLGARPEDAIGLMRRLTSHAEIQIDGLMSHFACADMRPSTKTLQQIRIFDDMQRDVKEAGFNIPFIHIANTAATLDFQESHFTAVRTGIALYGQYPSPQVERRISLKPAMSLKTRVVLVKDVPPGTGLSYGHTYVTKSASRIATIALGYADGYPRHASNKTVMLVNGKPAPVVGRVCMDQTLLNVSGIPGVDIGSEVLAFGVKDSYVLPADAVAASFESIGYELTSRVGKRLPRFFD